MTVTVTATTAMIDGATVSNARGPAADSAARPAAPVTVDSPAATTVATVAPTTVAPTVAPAGDLSTLRAVIEPAVDALGYELLHLEFSSHGGGRVLRLYIDAPGGIRVDDCEAVSRRLNALPDTLDALRVAEHLEVSSPGLDRPLVKPAHFQRFTGRRARIVMRRPGAAGRRRFSGELLAAGDERVLLEVDGERIELAYRDMATARVEPVF
ncbi:MAG: ribosome maturation factor RimP [Gammaproteobacteria bacterium]|nr:ribosome maturation factor RimP [Gammaproteobacteria bacterium]